MTGLTRKLRFGMVGGGGGFIGDVHRKAALFDGQCELTAGCFSRDAEKNAAAADAWGADPQRVYPDFYSMAQREAERRDKIDFAVVTTPNVFHYPAVKAFLEHGFHVVCDKPFTVTPEEAAELIRLARQKGCLVCVTYTNMGYAAVKQLRSLVQAGVIGNIRTVAAEYLCDCYAADESATDWRMDPAQSGGTSCLADIGTHIEHTVKYITGLKIRSLCAHLDYYRGRQLENNVQVLVKYDTGAGGIYWCSQIAVGEDNGLCIRVYGEKGTVEWNLIDCDRFKLTMLHGPAQTHARGRQAEKFSRLPAGHTEGFYEAFANIYREFCTAVKDQLSGKCIDEDKYDYPNAEDGLGGVIFTDSCQKSHRQGGIWISF